jgi:hypothetical protein
LRALALLAVLAAPAGCGGQDRQPPDPPAVRLAISAPADTAVVQDDTVEIAGRVSPARAAVSVLGEPTPVSGGAFSKRVHLDEGANVIDVAATMPGRSPAFAAVRVTHDPRVTVPDLTGVEEHDASRRLSELRLDPTVEHVGGLFDAFRGGPRRTCETDPPAGARLEPGTEVVVRSAKRC